MNRTHSVQPFIHSSGLSSNIQLTNQLNNYQVLIQSKSKLQDDLYSVQKQLRQKESELSKQEAVYEQRISQLTQSITAYSAREKMIKDMYERIFRAVKAAAENSSQSEAFLLELGQLGVLVNSFGHQVERCRFNLGLLSTGQTQTDSFKGLDCKCAQQTDDKQVQVSIELQMQNQSRVEIKKRKSRFQQSPNQVIIDLTSNQYDSPPYAENEIQAQEETPLTLIDAKMKPHLEACQTTEFSEIQVQQSKQVLPYKIQLLASNQSQQEIPRFQEFKESQEKFLCLENNSNSNSLIVSTLEKELKESQQLISYLKSAAQKQEEVKTRELFELNSKVQKMETRYQKKKKALKDCNQENVIKLKQQLAEALKVANLKSEEAIKWKAELSYQLQNQNQRSIMQKSMASSDVLRQSLMVFKDQENKQAQKDFHNQKHLNSQAQEIFKSNITQLSFNETKENDHFKEQQPIQQKQNRGKKPLQSSITLNQGKTQPFFEKALNTESAPRNMLESHAKLYSKFVNSVSNSQTNRIESGSKQDNICTVQVTLTNPLDIGQERVSYEQQVNTTAATGKFKSNSDLDGQANILDNEQDLTDQDSSKAQIQTFKLSQNLLEQPIFTVKEEDYQDQHSNYLIFNENSYTSKKVSEENQCNLERNSPSNPHYVSLQHSAEPASEAKQQKINVCKAVGTTPYFKEGERKESLSSKFGDNHLPNFGHEQAHIESLISLRESASVNPCCFENEILLANALPSSHYNGPTFGDKNETNQQLINFKQIKSGFEKAESVDKQQSQISKQNSEQAIQNNEEKKVTSQRQKNRFEVERGSRYNQDQIDNSTEQLVIIECSPMRYSPRELNSSNNDRYQKLENFQDDYTDTSQSPMQTVMQMRAAQKFANMKKQFQKSESQTTLSQTTQTPLKIAKLQTGQTTPCTNQVMSLKTIIQKGFAITPSKVSKNYSPQQRDQNSPFLQNDCSILSNLPMHKRNSQSPSVSPSKLEQEEIDKIVDQIVSHLRNIKDGETPIEFSDQKKGISTKSTQCLHDCTCTCQTAHKKVQSSEASSHQPVISCTHYHNHFETKQDFNPQNQAASKLEYYLGKLEGREKSIQNILKEKEASEAKCSKLQRKLKLLREKINSLCQNQSLLQGPRLEKCLKQAQNMLIKDLESDEEFYQKQKIVRHVKSPSMAGAEALLKAQAEMKNTQILKCHGGSVKRNSQKQKSPVQKVFQEQKQATQSRLVQNDQKLYRTKSGTQRTPLNLDVSQVFQTNVVCQKPNMLTGTDPIQRKKQLNSLAQNSQYETNDQFLKSQTMPAQELKQQLQKHFSSSKANDFIFRERENVYRSVINASQKSQNSLNDSQKNTQKHNFVLPNRKDDCDSDMTTKLNHLAMSKDQQNSGRLPQSVNLQSFSIRKIEHIKGYLPVRNSKDEEEQNCCQNKLSFSKQFFEDNSQHISNQTRRVLDKESSTEYHQEVVEEQFFRNQYLYHQEDDSSFNVNEQLMMMEQDEDLVQSAFSDLIQKTEPHQIRQQKVCGRQVVEKNHKILVIQGVSQLAKQLSQHPQKEIHSPVTIHSDDEEKTLVFGNETSEYSSDQMQIIRQRLASTTLQPQQHKYYKSPQQESEQNNRPRIRSQIENPKLSMKSEKVNKTNEVARVLKYT